MIVPSTKDEIEALMDEYDVDYKMVGERNGVTLRVYEMRQEMPVGSKDELYRIVDNSGVDISIEFRY